jgi:hypothetical protein
MVAVMVTIETPSGVSVRVVISHSCSPSCEFQRLGPTGEVPSPLNKVVEPQQVIQDLTRLQTAKLLGDVPDDLGHPDLELVSKVNLY